MNSLTTSYQHYPVARSPQEMLYCPENIIFQLPAFSKRNSPSMIIIFIGMEIFNHTSWEMQLIYFPLGIMIVFILACL